MSPSAPRLPPVPHRDRAWHRSPIPSYVWDFTVSRQDRVLFCSNFVWVDLAPPNWALWYWGHWGAAARPDSCLKPAPAPPCFSREIFLLLGAALWFVVQQDSTQVQAAGQIPPGAPHSHAPPCFGFSCVSPSGLLLTQALCIINSPVSTNEDYPCWALVSWRRSCIRSRSPRCRRAAQQLQPHRHAHRHTTTHF